MGKDKKIERIKGLNKKGEAGLARLWEMLSSENKGDKNMARAVSKLATALEKQNRIQERQLRLENKKLVIEARRQNKQKNGK